MLHPQMASGKMADFGPDPSPASIHTPACPIAFLPPIIADVVFG